MGDHGRVGDLGAGAQGGGDLAGFDAVAADLHLVVGAPDDLQGSVVPEAGEVAGTVHTGSGRPVGVGGEAFGGEGGPARVPLGEAVPGEVQLPHHPGGQRDEPPAEDVGAGVPERGADVRVPGPAASSVPAVDQMVVSVGP